MISIHLLGRHCLHMAISTHVTILIIRIHQCIPLFHTRIMTV